MKEYNMTFRYRSHNFNMSIQLDTKVERRMDGIRHHTITTSCMDFDNYYKKSVVEDKDLEKSIEEEKTSARRHIDKKIDGHLTETEKILLGMGFKK